MKTFRRVLLLLVVVCLATAAVVALAYSVVNRRGARRWETVRRGLEARGEYFDAAYFIPPAVRDEQNMAMAPFFTGLYQYRVDPVTGLLTFHNEGNAHSALTVDTIPYGKKDGGVSSGVGWAGARPLDLEKFRAYYRAQTEFPQPVAPASAADEVLTALTRFQPLIDELEGAAASRPRTRFPINWTQKPPSMILLPHDNLLQKLVTLLRLRACAELASDQPEAALRDFRLAFRLCDVMMGEPTLIASLVEVTCEDMLMQPIWEGLKARCWNATQLAEVQALVSQGNLLANYRHSIRAERVQMILPTIEDLRWGKNIDTLLSLSEDGEKGSRGSSFWMSTSYRLFPGGWYDEAKALASEMGQRYMIDPIQVEAKRVDARSVEQGQRAVADLKPNPRTVVTRITAPVIQSVIVRISRGQTTREEAATACALERFYLDHQAYPADLAALVPNYLERVPTDWIDGAPLRYEQTPAGRYRLWGVGWNEQDDGGKIVWPSRGIKPDERQGDWVWQYEPKEPLPAFLDGK